MLYLVLLSMVRINFFSFLCTLRCTWNSQCPRGKKKSDFLSKDGKYHLSGSALAGRGVFSSTREFLKVPIALLSHSGHLVLCRYVQWPITLIFFVLLFPTPHFEGTGIFPSFIFSPGPCRHWSVWGAHARPDRQTALSMRCPFFPPAQPITPSQYKHSFLWSTEFLWKRPFSWSLIKSAQPAPHYHPHMYSLCLPQPVLQQVRPFTEGSSDKQDRGSTLRQNAALTKACLIKIVLVRRLTAASWLESGPPTPEPLVLGWRVGADVKPTLSSLIPIIRGGVDQPWSSWWEKRTNLNLRNVLKSLKNVLLHKWMNFVHLV